MKRTKSIYEVSAMKFNGFDAETKQPILEEVLIEVINPRMKEGSEMDSIEKCVERKLGKREFSKISISAYRHIKDIVQEIDDELIEKYAKTEEIAYNEEWRTN